MENYDEHDKNYGALVNSISVAMVDKARGILMDLPKTIIYSADINGEHVTIEIRYRKTRGKYTFIVPQCLKMWNECCSEETLKYVKEQVKEAGEQAVKKYERKIERKAKNQ